jgi:hypothetical protein
VFLPEILMRLSWLPLLLPFACSAPFGGIGVKDSLHQEDSTPESPVDSEPPDDSVVPDDSETPDPPPRCEPRGVVTPAWPTEGDHVEVTFTCASGEDPSLFSASLHGIPAGARVDAANWTLTWDTSLADAGTHDLLLSVLPLAAPGSFPETALASISLADAWDLPANVPVDPERYTEEWGLPVLHLLPSTSVGGEYGPGTAWYRGRRHDIRIKLRGAVSRYYPKVGYNLDFGKVNLDASADGLSNKDKLVLLTTFDDNSYVRQKFCFDLWRDVAEHWGEARLTPRMIFVVVYLNGSYQGLFVAGDKVDDQFADQMGFSSEANIYKAYNHDGNFYRTDAYGRAKASLHQGYEKKEGAEGVWDDLDALVAFSADSSHAEFMASASGWIDVAEFMDWLLFVHFTAADDSGGKNSYLYDDPESPGFRFAPWDLHHAWGQDWRTLRTSASAYNDFRSNNGIFNHFLNDGEATATLWSRLESLRRDGPLSEEHLLARLDGYYEVIDPSAARDWARWGASYQSYSGWVSLRNSTRDWQDFEGEKAYLYTWVHDRVAEMWSRHPGEGS